MLSGLLQQLIRIQQAKQLNFTILPHLVYQVYLPGHSSHYMVQKITQEAEDTQGEFKEDYQIMFPGLSMCYTSQEEAERAI